jgi:hypothetical protein
VPAKPRWFSQLNQVVAELELSPRTFVDRATVEQLLHVGCRRAQQIIAPCVTDRVGSNGLADKATLVTHLRSLAASEDSTYETRRQRRVANFVQQQRAERLRHPNVLVEAPTEVINQAWINLPSGIELGPGVITTRFSTPQQGLESLLALAMAIGNDFETFKERVSLKHPVSS